MAPEKRKEGPVGKVFRYRPGKAPRFADEEDEDEVEQQNNNNRRGNAQNQHEVVSKGPATYYEVVPIKDSRLERAAAATDKAVAPKRERQVISAEVVRPSAPVQAEIIRRAEPKVKIEVDDNEDPEERRKRMRELALQRMREQEAAAAAAQGGAEEEEESEEEEEETDESSEEDNRRPLLKPVFVKKEARETITDLEKQEQIEQEMEERRKQQLEERKIESRQILADELIRDKEDKDTKLKEQVEGHEYVDTDDEENAAEEFETWKLRELRRVKRDKEERDKFEREEAETERRRKMTDAEIREEDKRLGINQPKEKGQQRFMQKYYHKGAFFMDYEDRTTLKEDIYNRDFSAPVLEEGANVENMPKPLQVRRGEFGKQGQTKWTHLTGEDTTDFHGQWWSKETRNIQQKMQSKMGGMKPVRKSGSVSTSSTADHEHRNRR